MRADFVQSIWAEADDLADADIQAIYATLEDRARAWLDEQDVDLDQVYLLRSADACFVGQSYEVNVPFADVAVGDLSVARVVGWFHDRYAKVYGFSDTDSPTRLLEARLQIVGVTPKPEVRLVAGQEDACDEAYGSRTIFENGREVQASIWRRGSLRQGRVYEGPMVVEQYDTTVYVPAGFRVTVDRWANLIGEKL
jgi:N-methylhydantoinase A